MSAQTRRGGEWTAWATATPMKARDPIAEPTDPLWFEFGRSRDEAISRLMRDLQTDARAVRLMHQITRHEGRHS